MTMTKCWFSLKCTKSFDSNDIFVIEFQNTTPKIMDEFPARIAAGIPFDWQTIAANDTIARGFHIVIPQNCKKCSCSHLAIGIKNAITDEIIKLLDVNRCVENVDKIWLFLDMRKKCLTYLLLESGSLVLEAKEMKYHSFSFYFEAHLVNFVSFCQCAVCCKQTLHHMCVFPDIFQTDMNLVCGIFKREIGLSKLTQ